MQDSALYRNASNETHAKTANRPFVKPKTIPELVIENFKQEIINHGLNDNQPGRKILEIIINRALYSRVHGSSEILYNIQKACFFDDREFKTVAVFLCSFPPVHSRVIGQILLTICQELKHTKKMITDCLDQIDLNESSKKLLDILLTTMSADKEQHKFLQQYLLYLLKLPSSESKTKKLKAFCEHLGDVPLVNILSKSDIYYLIELHLPENHDNFLRGTDFLSKLLGQLSQSVIKQPIPEISKRLQNLKELSIADNINQTEIVSFNQEFIDWLCSADPEEVFPKEVVVICQLIYQHLSEMGKKQLNSAANTLTEDKILIYVSGYILLRFLCPLIINFGLDQKEQKISLKQLASFQQQLKSLSTLIQALASNSEKELGEALFPGQRTLAANQENKTNIKKFLKKVSSDNNYLRYMSSAEAIPVPAIDSVSTNSTMDSDAVYEHDSEIQETLVKLLLRAYLTTCREQSDQLCEIPLVIQPTKLASPKFWKQTLSSPQTCRAFFKTFKKNIMIDGMLINKLQQRVQAEINVFLNTLAVRIHDKQAVSLSAQDLAKPTEVTFNTQLLLAEIKQLEAHQEDQLLHFINQTQNGLSHIPISISEQEKRLHKLQNENETIQSQVKSMEECIETVLKIDTSTQEDIRKEQYQFQETTLNSIKNLKNNLNQNQAEINYISDYIKEIQAKQIPYQQKLKLAQLYLLKHHLARLAEQLLIYSKAYESSKDDGKVSTLTIKGII